MADGLNDPNEPGTTVATHIGHVVERDRSIATLASLPPGKQAERASADAAWVVSDFAYEDG